MIASGPFRQRWNFWCGDLPLAALAGMVAILLLDANQALFLGFNRLGDYTGGDFWAHVTILGDALIVLMLCLPLARRWPELVWAGLLAGLLAAIFVQGFKHSLYTPRPAAVLFPTLFHIIGQTFLTGSFPSGHTATAFTFVGVVIFHLPAHWRRWLSAPLWLLAILVGLSRIVVGAHWPLDVLGGVVVGWLAAVLGTLWARRWIWGVTPSGRSWITLVLIGCAVTALVYYKTGYPETDLWRRILALLCLSAAIYPMWTEHRLNARSADEPGRL